MKYVRVFRRRNATKQGCADFELPEQSASSSDTTAQTVLSSLKHFICCHLISSTIAQTVFSFLNGRCCIGYNSPSSVKFSNGRHVTGFTCAAWRPIRTLQHAAPDSEPKSCTHMQAPRLGFILTSQQNIPHKSKITLNINSSSHPPTKHHQAQAS